MPGQTNDLSDTLRDHLAVCNELLALVQKESEALKNPAPFPMEQLRAERKELLARLEGSMRTVSERRARVQSQAEGGQPAGFPDLLQTTLDTIMRVLVLSRENEEMLLRRGLVPAHALPPPEQSQPGYVARVYQNHTRP
jgi:flagellar biosynthesis/type III secretory pathway chaperone